MFGRKKRGEKPVPTAQTVARYPSGSLLSELHRYPARARMTESLNANHGRMQVNACRLISSDTGLTAVPVRSKSGLITQLAGADGYLIIERDREGLDKGAEVEVCLD